MDTVENDLADKAEFIIKQIEILQGMQNSLIKMVEHKNVYKYSYEVIREATQNGYDEEQKVPIVQIEMKEGAVGSSPNKQA